ncbi:hypothetical protein [Alkalicoccobacillus murimartini]|uniref:Lipoprotein n=1 Tax=Alkalicoccobacillus murimartini TaxID=171685 RepID=A0ABT9YEA2_9BACI|nr:hypothetical protein [Alkalicoccobacillus murimartini]MDQ0206181.1 hypothetical protein [Alkalicoccobacillus murimartini]
MKRLFVALICTAVLSGCSFLELEDQDSPLKPTQIKREPSYIEPIEIEEQQEEAVYTNQH